MRVLLLLSCVCLLQSYRHDWRLAFYVFAAAFVVVAPWSASKSRWFYPAYASAIALAAFLVMDFMPQTWWQKYTAHWHDIRDAIQQPDESRKLPYLPVPNSEARFFGATIRMNEHGFRGNSFPRDKFGQFRIICLGESTTMGACIRATDEPWPDKLERMLGPGVQVINAGLSGYTLENNLHRLDHILSFEPDLIISYHGWNGFKFLPSGDQFAPIAARPRPSKTLQTMELRVKEWFRPIPPIDTTPLVECRYTELYRELIQRVPCPLVICTFNLAVNENSSEEVVASYKASWPSVRAGIEGNRQHTAIVSSLSGPDGVTIADVSAGIDGNQELFIDLVHFTDEGRQRLAENILTHIRGLLPAEVAPSAE